MSKVNNTRLHNRVAVITGACSDIGRAIAKALAEEGALLVLGDLDGKSLASLRLNLANDGIDAHIAAGDLSKQENAEALINLALTVHSRVDILVNNAGGGILRPFLEHTPETLKATVDRNLWTALWCSWLAISHMKEKRFGRVINIGADSVRNGLVTHAGYNAAKGGVHGMTTGLAREFALDNITVNTVAPCAVNTKTLEDFLKNNPETGDKILAPIPMGRPAETSEVASMVAYLAGDDAAFVTGQVISVNGGSTML